MKTRCNEENTQTSLIDELAEDHERTEGNQVDSSVHCVTIFFTEYERGTFIT